MKTIGLDVGNGSTCVFVRAEDGRVQSKMIASTFGAYDPEKQKTVGHSARNWAVPDVFSLQGRPYVIGYEDVRSSGSTPVSTYAREERTRLSAFETLTKLSLLDAATLDGSTGVIEVSLGFGVPNEDYREQKVQELASWFTEPITGSRNGNQVVVLVKHLEIQSQPIAVLMDAYYDEAGHIRDASLSDEDVLVIDAGSGTLDITAFRAFKLHALVSEPVGMNDVYRGIMADIHQREGKVRVDAFDIEHQLRAQEGKTEFTYVYGSTAVPITKRYQQEMDDLWVNIVGRIEQLFPDWTRFHRVLLAGGTGDALVPRFAKWMPRIQRTQDPQMAIARGLCKYAYSFAADVS